MRRIIRANHWHSVEVRVIDGYPLYGGNKEIRLAADQTARWNSTYLTPKAAQKLAEVLILAAKKVSKSERKKKKK